MKTIFITVSDGEVSKTVLQTEIFSVLKQKLHLVLLVPARSVTSYRELLGSEVVVEAMPAPASKTLDEFFNDLFLYSVHTRSIRVKIEHSYASGGSLLGKYAKNLLWFFGAFRWYRVLWRAVYSLMPDRTLDALFAAHRPAAVFAANLTSGEDARLLKAARRRDIPSVGLPKGWDNLTLKTFLPVFPDRLLVQTELMRADAVKLDYPKDRIAVVGFPKFDIYADRTKLLSREEFMGRFNFDPNRKLILYAGAGDQLAPHDEDILAAFLRAIEEGKVAGVPQVIVRPHPKYNYDAHKISARDFWKLDLPGKRLSGGGDFYFDQEDVAHLMNSLHHCDLLIHTASTLGVEASAFDRPSITLSYDAEARVAPAVSVARYYRYEHLDRVLKTGGTKVARSKDELIRYANDYLNDPSLDRTARARLARENTGPLDGRAGARVAQEILRAAGL